MIMLVVTCGFVIFLPSGRAVSVTVTPITPSSGIVGTSVRIIGTINTTGGSYKIWFSDRMVAGANASGNSVDTTFSVPAFPKGNHTVTLQDVAKNLNATTSFDLEPAFYINTILMPSSPKQLQENSTVTIQANMTGELANSVYRANITVETPAPSNETYWTLVPLNTTTDGNGTTTVVYPSDFHRTSRAPHTNYTGTYNIAFNKTSATNIFKIGLTNFTEYHRGQTVGIQVAGYKANEEVTLKITFGNKTIEPVINVNATEAGLILSSWPVPRNASMGAYTLNITSISTTPTTKKPPDVQTFIVPGYAVNVTTENLAKEAVQSVKVQVLENGTSVVNATSDSNGLARVAGAGGLTLETGSYTCKAVYRGINVNETSINVTGVASFILYCNLTNLKVSVIAVKDEVNLNVPEAKIYLKPENTTLTTDINGTAIVHSLLPTVNYTLNASRYDKSFNVTKLPSLLVNQKLTAWYNVTFTLPALTLRLNVTDANGELVDNAKVKAQELQGGLLYENNTNTEGIAIFQCAFGNYSVGIYDPDGIELNETTVVMFQNQNVSIRCQLWDLTLSVNVVDYLGQPISNVNVALQQDDLTPRSQVTQSNGIATFSSISGGNIQITIYLSRQTQPYMTEAVFVGSSTTIEIKLEKYVVLAGFLVDTSSLVTAILIIASVILVLLVEVYRRKRLKPQQKPKLEPK
jgi:hypothetical protein